MAALARREPPHYTYKRKVYVGKTKNPNAGIVGQMMYYLSEARLRGKIRRITDALDSDPVDVPSLKDLSITADGYIAVDLRCKVWSKLLNVNTLEISRNKDKKIAGEELATALLEQLSLHQLRDFMEGSMEKTTKMLAFLHPIIEEADPELREFLVRSEVGQVFALSWLITWYGHVLKDFSTIVRLYDFFLATHPLMPVYFGAALVIRRRSEVLAGECEMSYVHHLLSRIPDDLPDYVEELITTAHSLFRKFPPEKLSGAVDRYLKESITVAKHKQFIRELGDQRPDSVLRQRKKQLALYTNNELEVSQNFQSATQTNPYMKLAVWTLTASVGTMAIYVLSTAKRWI